MKNKKTALYYSLIVICLIAGVEAVALLKGVDGVALSSSMAVIGGIAGYIVRGFLCSKT